MANRLIDEAPRTQSTTSVTRETFEVLRFCQIYISRLQAAISTASRALDIQGIDE
jgi:hypothetical protein